MPHSLPVLTSTQQLGVVCVGVRGWSRLNIDEVSFLKLNILLLKIKNKKLRA